MPFVVFTIVVTQVQIPSANVDPPKAFGKPLKPIGSEPFPIDDNHPESDFNALAWLRLTCFVYEKYRIDIDYFSY